MRKNDLVLIAVVIILAAAMFFILQLYKRSDGKAYVSVIIGSDEVDRLNLDTDITREYTSDAGVNTVQISDGKCKVISADCYNQICVNSNEIDKAGESIVCMPHKFAVTVKYE